MESRPLRWERVRMSAAALFAVQMAITAVVPGADAPIPPPSAHPPHPPDPHGPPDRGLPDRLTGGPARDIALPGGPATAAAFTGGPARNVALTGGPAAQPGGPAAQLGGPARRFAFAGGPAGEFGGGRVIAVSALAFRTPAGRLPAGAFRLVLAADRQDAGSGSYGRAGGLLKLLGMTSGARTLDRPQRPLFQAHTQLSHRFAAGRLRDAGVKRRSTGRCTSRHRPTCTSYTAIRAGTIAQLIRLKRRSRCPILVTGGTETGHAHGPHSHGSGHKVDIAINGCVDAYIRRTHKRVGTRSDGAALYRSGSSATSDTFARERNHWDITFR